MSTWGRRSRDRALASHEAIFTPLGLSHGHFQARRLASHRQRQAQQPDDDDRSQSEQPDPCQRADIAPRRRPTNVAPPSASKGRDVVQATVQGRWKSPGVFLTTTAERLIIDQDGRAKWGRDDWPGLNPYRWNGPMPRPNR